jgi:hypothetical protein
MAARRRTAASALALALLVSGCAAGGGEEPTEAEPAASPSPSEPSPQDLPPPAQDGRVGGALSAAALPAPPGFRVVDDDEPPGDTGPFTLRSYVRAFYDGDKQLLKDVRLSRMRRGYHRYAEDGRGRWMHVYLFETRDNLGATTLRSMLFGEDGAESYTVRSVDDAVGQIYRNRRDDDGRYSSVEIAFATGNVYARVIAARRGGRPDPRLAEKLAAAQLALLQQSFQPTA